MSGELVRKMVDKGYELGRYMTRTLDATDAAALAAHTEDMETPLEQAREACWLLIDRMPHANDISYLHSALDALYKDGHKRDADHVRMTDRWCESMAETQAALETLDRMTGLVPAEADALRAILLRQHALVTSVLRRPPNAGETK